MIVAFSGHIRLDELNLFKPNGISRYFRLYQSIHGLRVADCFTLIVFLLSCWAVGVLWLFLAMPWVDLRSVIVVFPGHTHFLKNKKHY